MMDIGKVMRLRDAISGALSAVEADTLGSGNALPSAYTNLRQQVKSTIEDELQEEFESLFPAWSHPPLMGSRRPGFDPLKVMGVVNEAKALLGQLSGWLDGFVSEARLALEAKEYAEQRLREDRKIGFAKGES